MTFTILLLSAPWVDRLGHWFVICDGLPSLYKRSEAYLRLFWLTHLPIDYFLNK